MVMMPDVVYSAYKSIQSKDAKVIYMTPQGKKLDQKKVEDLSKENHLIILCGHYEGIDQRVIDKIVDEEISIGDYVKYVKVVAMSTDTGRSWVIDGNP